MPGQHDDLGLRNRGQTRALVALVSDQGSTGGQQIRLGVLVERLRGLERSGALEAADVDDLTVQIKRLIDVL